ncbi:MAG: TRAP transporter small permease subunit, partial [Rhodospirillaceae bacterium]|nr:TRAP transporter small permease subunit [Rhodospirillaceae bacterium]
MIVIIFDVVSRRFFVLGSTKLQELEWHLHTVLFIFCLGYAFLPNAHVRIDLFRSRISNRL